MIKEIKFTDKAIKQINHLLSTKDKGSFFRIAIKGGGCSGFQYDFSFDQKQNDDSDDPWNQENQWLHGSLDDSDDFSSTSGEVAPENWRKCAPHPGILYYMRKLKNVR